MRNKCLIATALVLSHQPNQFAQTKICFLELNLLNAYNITSGSPRVLESSQLAPSPSLLSFLA